MSCTLEFLLCFTYIFDYIPIQSNKFNEFLHKMNTLGDIPYLILNDLSLKYHLFFHVDICLLSNNIMDYYIVSQGKTTIPNVDDGEEFTLTDVRNLRAKSMQF